VHSPKRSQKHSKIDEELVAKEGVQKKRLLSGRTSYNTKKKKNYVTPRLMKIWPGLMKVITSALVLKSQELTIAHSNWALIKCMSWLKMASFQYVYSQLCWIGIRKVKLGTKDSGGLIAVNVLCSHGHRALEGNVEDKQDSKLIGPVMNKTFMLGLVVILALSPFPMAAQTMDVHQLWLHMKELLSWSKSINQIKSNQIKSSRVSR
jgi:hypothetical protein